jgi:hypothetical protein
MEDEVVEDETRLNPFNGQLLIRTVVDVLPQATKGLKPSLQSPNCVLGTDADLPGSVSLSSVIK